MSLKIKNNKKALSKMLIVAIALVVIIVIAGVVAYCYMAPPADTTTPTAEPSSTASTSPSTEPSETAEPSGTTTGVAGASSMKYSVNLIENGVPQISYTFMGKNIGTNDFSMVAQIADTEGETIYIFNGAQHKAWSYMDGEWEDISVSYDMQWGIWNNLWSGYMTNLAAWTGTGDYTYNQEGGVIVEIEDIQVNPVLDDSLFEHVFV